MSIVTYGGKIVKSAGKIASFPKPSETPAISFLQNFLTGINAFIADEDRLPSSQLEIEAYSSFDPVGVYTFFIHP